MPRYALVDLNTMLVLDVKSGTVPGAIPGIRYIVENPNPTLNEWKTGVDEPAVGDEWDGQIPAGFAPPVPPDGLPTTLPEAWQVVLDRKAALAEAEANFQVVAGLP